MTDIRITPGSAIIAFTSSGNYKQTLKQDPSGSLIILGSGSTGRTELFTVNGNNGTLFSVSDDLSDSLFSVNTIAGLPVIEAFANNTVILGQYGQNVLVITGSRVGIGTAAPTRALHVNGGVGISSEIVDMAGYFQWNGDNAFYAGGYDAKTNITYTLNNGIASVTDLPQISGDWNGSQRFNGQTLTRCTAGETITAGQLVYLNTDGNWYLTNARYPAKSTPLLGIALDDAGSTGPLSVLLDGIIVTTYHTQNTTAASGAPLYVESQTNGSVGSVTEIATTSTGEAVRLIGHNIYDTSNGVIIRFQPDNTWIEL